MRLALAIVALVTACLAAGGARALDPARTIAQLRHTAWTQRDGMPGVIAAVAQTPDGYLWIASLSGLFRFDGVRVEAYPHQFPDVAVSRLAVTPNGDLWIASPRHLSRLSHGVLTTFALPATIPAYDVILLLTTGPNGDVWLATDSRVARFDGRAWQVMDGDWGSSERFRKPGGVWGLAVARDGVAWAKNVFATYYLRPGSTRFLKADGYGGGQINFARAPDGRLWTADQTLKRFYALPDLPRAGPAPPPRLGAPAPPGVLGWAMFDRDGTLWCANSVTGGICRLRSVTDPKATTELFHERDGLSSDSVAAPFEDREGDVWIPTQAGVDRFSPANIVAETGISIRPEQQDIAASSAAAYVADGWAAPIPHAQHDVERIYRITTGAPQLLPIKPGNLTGFLAAADDTLLMTSGSRDILYKDGRSWTVPAPPGTEAADAFANAKDGDDLWVALQGPGVFRRRNGRWTQVTAPGLSLERDVNIVVDGVHGIWLFQEGVGIARVSGNRVEVYEEAATGIGEVSAFFPQGAGVILGGARGVSWFDGRAFHPLAPQQAPFLTNVMGVVADDVGWTWLNTPAGIYRVQTDQLERAFRDPGVRLDFRLFDDRDGLRSGTSLSQFGGNAVRSPDGRLWFLTSTAALWIDPHDLYRNVTAPPVSIQSITAGGRVFSADGDPKLAAGTSNLQIDYTALSLQDPARVRFRYQLEGVDRTWVDAGARRQAFYTRLGPGRYRFRVIAANNDGVWNTTGATLAFRIPPTFVQSVWFVLLCVLLAAAALWLAYQWRLGQVTAAIQSRLEERVAERERIARELHDTLLQGFQGLVLRFQAIMEQLPSGAPARAQMDAALERADEVMISGRDRVRQLRTLGEGDLAEALAATARAASVGSDARFRLVVDGAPRALHPMITEELAAIGREAVVNAFQHANAGNIDVTLSYGRRELSMRIADDGAGIDARVLAAGGRAGHFGLTGMRERAQRIEARFAVASRPGEGCDIAVTVPAHVAYASLPEESAARRWLRGALDRLALISGGSRGR